MYLYINVGVSTFSIMTLLYSKQMIKNISYTRVCGGYGSITALKCTGDMEKVALGTVFV